MHNLPLRLLTWNLHGLPWPGHYRRLSLAVELALAQDADVLLLQEIWSTRTAERLIVQLRAEGYIAAMPGESLSGRRCGGLLTAARPPWQPCAPPTFSAFAAHAAAWKLWEGDGLMRKGLLHVTLARGNAKCEFMNTHLQSQYGSRWHADGEMEAKRPYLDVRRAQLRQIGDHTMRLPARPVIIAGDFNTQPDELVELRLPTTWREASAQARHGRDMVTYLGRRGLTEWLDYIFVDDSRNLVSTVAARVMDGSGLSDHHAVVVDLQFSPDG